MKKYFGTDGIRGIIGKKLVPKLAYSLGVALTQKIYRPRILVGRDTRTSGETFSHAFSAGVLAGGGMVIDCGVTSTPSICYLTKNLDFDFGLVISASHNPPEYNGLKLFDSNGYKLSDEREIQIEQLFDRNPTFFDGKYRKDDGILKLYTSFLERQSDLSGLKIALDCSNGAVKKLAPRIFRKLGAQVFCTGNSGNGKKINSNCGCLHIEHLISFMKNKKADVGFAFDGDADRVIAVDEKGNVVDGDNIIYILAKYLRTNNDIIVGTTQTNSAIEKELKKIGKTFLRSDVGDKYVLEEMLKSGAIIGGEKAGHIILLDKNTSGDGVLTAITISNIIKQTKKTLSELNNISLFPQKTVNMSVKDKSVIFRPEVIALQKELSHNCRIVLRASGTEDVIRIMCESEDESVVDNAVSLLYQQIEQLINCQ